MVTEYGMSEKLGPLQFGSNSGGQVFLGRDIQNEQNYSDQIAYEIDQEVKNFIQYCYDRAKTILTENRDKLELIAKTLLEVETLDATQIRSLFDKGRLPTDEELEALAREHNAKIKNNTSSGSDEDVRVNIQSKDEEAAEEEQDTEASSTNNEEENETDSDDRRS